jgi:hypothetical protein
VTDDELDRKKRQRDELQSEINEETWRRYVAAHPEKDIGKRSWESLDVMDQRCTNDDNPTDVCVNLDGMYDYAPCVFCGRSWGG